MEEYGIYPLCLTWSHPCQCWTICYCKWFMQKHRVSECLIVDHYRGVKLLLWLSEHFNDFVFISLITFLTHNILYQQLYKLVIVRHLTKYTFNWIKIDISSECSKISMTNATSIHTIFIFFMAAVSLTPTAYVILYWLLSNIFMFNCTFLTIFNLTVVLTMCKCVIYNCTQTLRETN